MPRILFAVHTSTVFVEPFRGDYFTQVKKETTTAIERLGGTIHREKTTDLLTVNGEFTASIRAEPKTFNRLEANEASSDLVAVLTQGKLVRVNRVTQDVEPWLAETWTTADEGRTITLKLRPNVVFSDGRVKPTRTDGWGSLHEEDVPGGPLLVLPR